jgi:hypothetical protein
MDPSRERAFVRRVAQSQRSSQQRTSLCGRLREKGGRTRLIEKGGRTSGEASSAACGSYPTTSK